MFHISHVKIYFLLKNTKGAKFAPIVYFAQKLYILTQDIDYTLFRHLFLLYFFIYHVARCQLAVNIFK